MKLKNKTQPGVCERFTQEVSSRAGRLRLRPEDVLYLARVTPSNWLRWTDEGRSPTASTMDKVLAKLAELETK